MIQAIVFDYGNVISEPQDLGCFARMASLSGLSEAFFSRSFWTYRPDFDRGTLGGVELYRQILTDGGYPVNDRHLAKLASRLLAEDMRSWSRVSAPVTEWARELKSRGYRIGILSNMPFEFLDCYGSSIELFSGADVTVFSCHVRQIKPEPAIYQTLIQRCGCRPDEIVFFDDIQANVQGALDAGIRAFCWTGLAQARQDLNSLV